MQRCLCIEGAAAAAAAAAAAQVRVPVTKRASPALLLALRSYTDELLKGGLRFLSYHFAFCSLILGDLRLAMMLPCCFIPALHALGISSCCWRCAATAMNCSTVGG
jgi:hypothetical protein